MSQSYFCRKRSHFGWTESDKSFRNVYYYSEIVEIMKKRTIILTGWVIYISQK